MKSGSDTSRFRAAEQKRLTGLSAMQERAKRMENSPITVKSAVEQNGWCRRSPKGDDVECGLFRVRWPYRILWASSCWGNLLSSWEVGLSVSVLVHTWAARHPGVSRMHRDAFFLPIAWPNEMICGPDPPGGLEPPVSSINRLSQNWGGAKDTSVLSSLARADTLVIWTYGRCVI